MAGTQGFFERSVQFFWTRIGAFFQITGEKLLVFFDDLIDQRAMCRGD